MKSIFAVGSWTGRAFALAVVGGLCVCGSAARADQLTLDLGTSINGSTPAGTTPWLTAVFSSTTPGTVTLTLTNNLPFNSHAQNNEFTKELFFNTTVNANNLTFSPTHEDTTSSKSSLYDSQVKAGLFNIEINLTNRLYGGNSVTFTITDSADKITAASFDVTSVAGSKKSKNESAGKGGWLGAAEILGISNNEYCGDNTTSGSIGTKTGSYTPNFAVPEPASMTMALIGLSLAGGNYVLNRVRVRKRSATPAV